MSWQTAHWDHVIIGAGSAGCALAARLAEDPSKRILLVEAGGMDLSPFIHVPAGIVHLIGNPRHDWMMLGEADPSRAGRVDLWPAGKGLGGSSSINGMLWVRGTPADYDAWETPGWGWAEIAPVFRRIERTGIGDRTIRGVDGPMSVEPLRTTHPVAITFGEAAVEAGLPENPDYNGAVQEGVSPAQVTQRCGRRFSAARAYLSRPRNNLKIVTGWAAERLVIEAGACTGAVLRKGGRRTIVSAREVCVSAGALNTPKLLMLSGIGPADVLKSHGVPVFVDAPSVGRNLQEHPEGMISIHVTQRTYNMELHGPGQARAALEWLFLRKGPATSPYPHKVAYFKTDPALANPNIQVMFGPFAFDFDEKGVIPYVKPAVGAAFNITHPRARGEVTLRSKDPGANPVIRHGVLSNDEDMAEMIAGARRIRAIFEQPAFDGVSKGERLPGPEVESDDEWADYLRRTTFLGYHPVGTCRMGSDAASVVDERLRVRGVAGLRIVDASVMPRLISGNTNAAVIAIGERAAELIKAAA